MLPQFQVAAVFSCFLMLPSYFLPFSSFPLLSLIQAECRAETAILRQSWGEDPVPMPDGSQRMHHRAGRRRRARSSILPTPARHSTEQAAAAVEQPAPMALQLELSPAKPETL